MFIGIHSSKLRPRLITLSYKLTLGDKYCEATKGAPSVTLNSPHLAHCVYRFGQAGNASDGASLQFKGKGRGEKWN